MSFVKPFHTPFFFGNATSPEVPYRYLVSLGGRAFSIDWLGEEALLHQTIAVQRPQADTSERPGEQTLNPEGFWPRSVEGLKHGAGQTYFDRKDSDDFRFRASKGIDVFGSQEEFSLLHDTANKFASVASNLDVMSVGDRLYMVDGNEVYYSTDLVTRTPTTVRVAETASPVTSIATDGFNIWATVADGIHTVTRAIGASWVHMSNNPIGGAFTLLGYVKSRLLAVNANSIYNITPATLPLAPGALFTHPNDNFVWVGFAESPKFIYAAGYSGDRSQIYRIGIKDDGTGLEAPVPATPGLPDGELIHSIESYVGFLTLGTNRGVRNCQLDGDGSIIIGPLVPTAGAVRAFEGQDTFMFFGWSNYDADSTGLGRLDLSTDTGTAQVPTPAYASDLMATGQGEVISIATFNNKRVFAVSGLGIFQEADTLVPSGYLDSGYLTFGISEPKIAMFFDVRTRAPIYGTVKAYISTDRGAFEAIGGETIAVGNRFTTNERKGELFETRVELNRSAVDTTTGPHITRQTLLANPVTDSGIFIIATLKLAPNEYVYDQDIPRNPVADYAFIRNLRRSRALVSWQQGTERYSVTVEDYKWKADKEMDRDAGHPAGFQGSCTVRLKSLSS